MREARGSPSSPTVPTRFHGTLDYIFYTDDTLAPLSLLELPTEQVRTGQVRRLPSPPSAPPITCLSLAEFQWGARQW